jgi:hypothetical protein
MTRLPTDPAEPVDIRLIATKPAVALALAVLDQVFTLSDVSDPQTARGGKVRVYATITRRTPLTGGPR